MAVVLDMQLHKTSTKCRTPLLYSLICEPLVLIEGLGCGVKRAPAEAVILRLAVGGRFKHVMGGHNLGRSVTLTIRLACFRSQAVVAYLRIQCLQQLLFRMPCAIHWAAAWLLASRKAYTVRFTIRRVLFELLGLGEVSGWGEEHDGLSGRFALDGQNPLLRICGNLGKHLRRSGIDLQVND